MALALSVNRHLAVVGVAHVKIDLCRFSKSCFFHEGDIEPFDEVLVKFFECELVEQVFKIPDRVHMPVHIAVDVAKSVLGR